MPISQRRKIETGIEKRIVTGMIVSKEYMQGIYPLIDLSYFQNSYIEKVAKWCLDYYGYYEKAPFDTITDIFNLEKPKLSEEETELTKMLLSEISERYSLDEGINVPYLTDRTIDWCKTRELEITAGNIGVLLSRGDLKAAEEQVTNFRKIQRLTSNWVNPFSEEEIWETFQDEDNDFFRFPGVLGSFLGPFDRGWLVGLSGAFKGGKTWFVQEFAVVGVLSGLRVAFFSLEMSKKEMKRRFYRRFTAAGDKGGAFVYPTFDCVKNQDNSCNLPQRTQSLALLDANGDMPNFDRENPYRVCNECRALRNREWVGTHWYEVLERPEFSPYQTEQTMRGFRKQFGHLYRMKSYPRFSANVADIRRDLDILEQIDSFVPDIIIVDYADILKPEDSASSGIEKEDRSWIALSQLAAERHALVVAPTQVKIDALDANIIKQKHMARWIGKLGHVDVMMAKNQTEEEKRLGRSRIGILAHRHKDFSPGATVTLLEQLDLGQPHLDSAIIIEQEREEEE